jgi:ABC-type transport system involved in multi-copper enzyme maturation permease subunit
MLLEWFFSLFNYVFLPFSFLIMFIFLILWMNSLLNHLVIRVKEMLELFFVALHIFILCL